MGADLAEASSPIAELVDATYRLVNQLSGALRDWPAAPGELHGLRDTTGRLHNILNSALQTHQRSVPSTLYQDFNYTARVLALLEDIVEDSHGPVGAVESSVQLRRWWSMQRRSVVTLQADLDGCCHRIIETLMAMNVSVALEFHPEPKNMLFDGRAPNNIIDVEPKSLHFVEQKLRSPSEPKVQSTVELRHRSLRGEDGPLQSSCRPNARAADYAFVEAGVVMRSPGNDQTFHFLESTFASLVSSSRTASTASSASSRRHSSIRSHPLVQRSQSQAFTCHCHCHARDTVQKKSLRWGLVAFKSTMGSFSLHFNVKNPQPKDAASCTVTDCRYTCFKRTEARVSYTFPTWLFHTAITAVFSNSARRNGSPELLLRVIRRIPPEEVSYSVINDVRTANLPAIQRAFTRRQHTVFDAHGRDGTTLIGAALLRQNLDMVRLLMSEGADIFQQDDFGNAPFRDALMQIYATTHNSRAYRQELAQLLPIDEALDAAELPDLHKVILGILCVLDLEEYLDTHAETTDINALDGFDRPALWYASCQGDTNAVRTLLAAGANPNAAPGYGPLHIAARYGRVEVVRELLAAGAAVDERSQWRVTPLIGVTDEATARALVGAGADVNATEAHGSSALHYAALYDRVGVAQFLMDSGADVDHSDDDGDPAIALAIFRNSQDVLSLLFERGVDIQKRNHIGDNLFHRLARYANVGTLEMLAQRPELLTELDLEEENRQGKTPMQLCCEREATDGGLGVDDCHLSEAFAKLLDKVTTVGAQDIDEADSEDFDEFFDAKETVF